MFSVRSSKSECQICGLYSGVYRELYLLKCKIVYFVIANIHGVTTHKSIHFRLSHNNETDTLYKSLYYSDINSYIFLLYQENIALWFPFLCISGVLNLIIFKQGIPVGLSLINEKMKL